MPVVFHFPLLPRSAVPYIYIFWRWCGVEQKSELNTAFMYAKGWTRLWPPVLQSGSSLSSSTRSFSEAVMSVRALLPPLLSWILTSPKVRAKFAILLHPQSKHGSALLRLLRSAEHADLTPCDWYNQTARVNSNLWLHRRKQKPLYLQQWTSALLLGCNKLQT